MINKEKAKVAKLEAKVAFTIKTLENQKLETQSWRSRAEEAQKIGEAQPRKTAVLLADLEKAKSDNKALEARVSDLTKRLDKEEKENKIESVEKKAEDRIANSAVVHAEVLKTLQTELEVAKKARESEVTPAPVQGSLLILSFHLFFFYKLIT